MKKGIVVTTTMLVTIIFIIIAVVVLFLLVGSFEAEAGRPASSIFFQLFDWITKFISG